MVSIIVPVYNTAAYLHDCVDSLLAQTYQNIEILLANDGSDDQSGEICDQYAAKDNRVRVLHLPHAGVSSARNAALKMAKGVYVAFVDSDDWIAPDFIAEMRNAMIQKSADFAMCGRQAVHSRRKARVSRAKREYVLAESEVYSAFLEPTIGGYVCNKLFLRHRILQDYDPNLHVCEDFVFCATYAQEVKRTVVLTQKLYFYWQDHTRLHSTLDARVMTLLDSREALMTLYAKNYPALYPRLLQDLVKSALHLRARYKYLKMDDPQISERIDGILDRYYQDVYTSASLPSRINLALTRRYPVAVFKLKNKLLGRKIK